MCSKKKSSKLSDVDLAQSIVYELHTDPESEIYREAERLTKSLIDQEKVSDALLCFA